MKREHGPTAGHAFPPIPTVPRQGGRRGKPVQKYMSQYLVGGYEGRGRGKHPSKGQDVSHRLSPGATICSLYAGLAVQPPSIHRESHLRTVRRTWSTACAQYCPLPWARWRLGLAGWGRWSYDPTAYRRWKPCASIPLGTERLQNTVRTVTLGVLSPMTMTEDIP